MDTLTSQKTEITPQDEDLLRYASTWGCTIPTTIKGLSGASELLIHTKNVDKRVESAFVNDRRSYAFVRFTDGKICDGILHEYPGRESFCLS